MALWLVRTGSHGEHEQRFINDQRIYLTWEGLNCDLATLQSQQDFQQVQRRFYPDQTPGAVAHYARQMRKFVVGMKPGDWVVIPGKLKPAINIAEITGPYTYAPNADNPFYYHYRPIRWVEKDIPRSNFEQDLLYSFGAFSTVCQIQRNEAEQRVREMAGNAWKPKGLPPLPSGNGEDPEVTEAVDLERLARDQIAKLIIRKFKGHGLARLIEAILRVQGYTVYRSPEGPDKGIDLLAAPGPLGFGHPRICVQVKSGDTPVDAPTLSQLIGAMDSVRADQGLLVSWGGFKSSVDKDAPSIFFRVRLWDQDTIIDELLAHYDQLDADLRAELPFKRVWAVALPEEE